MRSFDDSADAIRFAASGGCALLLTRCRPKRRGAPRGPVSCGWIYDCDAGRLRRTIRRLRIGPTFILEPGTRRQRVRVPRDAVDRARRMCDQEELIVT